MAPTRIYVKPVLQLLRELPVKGMAHITGGGLVENIPRCLPEALTAELDAGAWRRPEIFDWLQREGGVAPKEMHRTFNCGIGYVLIVGSADASGACAMLTAAGEQAQVIGRVRHRDGAEPQCVVRQP
jgi:phosphoribosylformylglycinamidine cyclo-ligase